jgi:hypothetical protein
LRLPWVSSLGEQLAQFGQSLAVGHIGRPFQVDLPLTLLATEDLVHDRQLQEPGGQQIVERSFHCSCYTGRRRAQENIERVLVATAAVVAGVGDNVPFLRWQFEVGEVVQLTYVKDNTCLEERDSWLNMNLGYTNTPGQGGYCYRKSATRLQEDQYYLVTLGMVSLVRSRRLQ